MIDVDLIQQCADPRLEVAIVQQFVVEMNAPDHLTIRVFQGEKMILVPAPKSAEEAVETTRQWVGKANVRVGLTQYPAGLGIADAAEIGLELFDTCENLRLGTELFGKVLRIVGERDEEGEASQFEMAVKAYFTGWFEGEQVFYADEPDKAHFAVSRPADMGLPQSESMTEQIPIDSSDPNAAGIRVDLSILNLPLKN
ncbi:conjugal transfer protein TraH [Notoacmeibacter sp. MSK16QG-6]|uniref:conjugal transfer protein TraH n=1 Tax=Notoacmeibacter sp. MSK16QG-6 TaxID=2957982 RepID=UPI0020A118E8|nr:conjugal transfer protein TraH [Notoacmeibacter sp. MSK16QG-6]MCP1201009.1 conjugal transfer protein TraH [Notoacmeibacter sp. MSK16QG-6]